MVRIKLLRALRGAAGLTESELARVLDIPRASVRRIIGELRAYGITVTCACGFYSLQGE